MTPTKFDPSLLASNDPAIRFEQWLRIRNKAEDTVKRYKNVIQEFLEVVGEKDRYGKEDVDTFLAHLETKDKQRYRSELHPKVGGTYRRFCYYALKTFFRSRGEQWPLQKEDVPKTEEPTRLFYEMDEVDKVLDAVKKANTGKNGKLNARGMRDWLALRVGVLTMSRRKGIGTLKRWDYDPKTGTVTMPSIKGGRKISVELDKETRSTMDRYLLHRTDIYPALFPSFRPWNDQGTMRLASLNDLLKHYCEVAGVDYKGMHAFRRGVVTYYYDQGLREREIFEMGDWKSEAMVFKYVQLSKKYAGEKRKQMHPFFRK